MSTPTDSIPSSSADAYAFLLQHHSAPQALEVLQTKVQSKPLPLHPTATATATTAADARTTRRLARLSKKPSRKKPLPLTAKEKRALGVHALPKTFSYSTFLPLHTLWLSYARSLAAMGGGAAAMAGRLASGDLHGALVEVVRSRAVDRVGIRGIVVKETRRTVVVVTTEDEGKTVPKEYTVFRVSVAATDDKKVMGRSNMVFELQGSQMMFRAAERAGKKYKAKPMLDL